MQRSLKKKNIIYLKFLHDFFNQNKTLQEWNGMLEFHILKEYSLGIYTVKYAIIFPKVVEDAKIPFWLFYEINTYRIEKVLWLIIGIISLNISAASVRRATQERTVRWTWTTVSLTPAWTVGGVWMGWEIIAATVDGDSPDASVK